MSFQIVWEKIGGEAEELDDGFPPYAYDAFVPVDTETVERDIEDVHTKFSPYAIILFNPVVSHYQSSALAYRACCATVEHDYLFNEYLASVHEISQSAQSLNHLLDKWFVRCCCSARRNSTSANMLVLLFSTQAHGPSSSSETIASVPDCKQARSRLTDALTERRK